MSCKPEARAGNVWLASYPRSGNTFFRIILSERYGLPSLDGDGPSRTKLWHRGVFQRHGPPSTHVDELPHIDRDFDNQRIDPTVPQFIKTHNLPGKDDYPAIYIVRDGRDALVSYAHYVLDFLQPADPSKNFRRYPFWTTLYNLLWEERSPYGTWSQNVNAWMARPNTTVVRYEDLVLDPLDTTERALSAIGLVLRPDAIELPSFQELRALDPKFFRRGAIDENRKEFPRDLLKTFWDRNGEAMERLGYVKAAAA